MNCATDFAMNALFSSSLACCGCVWGVKSSELRRLLYLHAVLVGAAVRMRLRHDPLLALGVEAARFHDRYGARRSLFGRRAVGSAEDEVVPSAYDIGLLRIQQQGEQQDTLSKLGLSDTSPPLARAALGVDVARDTMQLLHRASPIAHQHRSRFVISYLFDPLKPTLVQYLIFVVVLTALAYFSSTGNLPPSTSSAFERSRAYWLNSEVADLPTGNPLPPDEGSYEVKYYADLQTPEDFFDWLGGTFLENVMPDDSGWIDSNNRLLGNVQIRQVRVKHKPGGCDNPDWASRHDDDSDAVCLAYDTIDRSDLVLDDDTVVPFKVVADGIADTARSALWRKYPFEGNVQQLPNGDAEEAARLVGWMANNSWVDADAMAVYVDYTVFNPALQRLVAVELLLEIPETGTGVPHSRVYVLPSLQWINLRWDSWTAYIAPCLMLGFVVLSVLKEIYDEGCELLESLAAGWERVVRKGRGRTIRWWPLRLAWRFVLSLLAGIGAYVDDIYNFFDIMSAALVFCWGWHWAQMVYRFRELDLQLDFAGDWVADDAENDTSTGVAHGDVYYPINERVVPALESANDLISLGVFFSWLKLIKFARLFPVIGPMVQASSSTVFNFRVITFLIFFFFYTFAFAIFANIAFGGRLDIYQDLISAFLSCFAQQLGDSALDDMQQQRWGLGTMFYMLMAVIGTIVLTNIFIGVVCSAYDEMHESSQEAWEQELHPLMVAPVRQRLEATGRGSHFARLFRWLLRPLRHPRASLKSLKSRLKSAQNLTQGALMTLSRTDIDEHEKLRKWLRKASAAAHTARAKAGALRRRGLRGKNVIEWPSGPYADVASADTIDLFQARACACV